MWGGATIVLAALVLITLWFWQTRAEPRAVARLRADERAQIYRREMENFQTLCGQGPRNDVLENRCKQRADFILQFPECDVACQQLARAHMPVVNPR
jgi:cytochrome b pre-mRNA-processing protein 3